MAYLITPKARLSWPALFTPKTSESGFATYEANLVFYSDEHRSPAFKALRDAVKAMLTERFGPKGPPKGAKLDPFRDGEEKNHEAGTLVLRVSSKNKPGIVDQQRQPITDPDRIYPGCWVRASVQPAWYDFNGNRGVKFYLGNIQFVGDAPRFGGGARAEQEFEALPVDVTEDFLA